MYTPEKYEQKTPAGDPDNKLNNEVGRQLDAMFNQLESLELISNRLFDRINLIMKPSTNPAVLSKDEQSNECETISPLTERLLSYNRRIYRVISDIESVIDRIEL